MCMCGVCVCARACSHLVNQILRFFAYFEEEIPDSPLENVRVRNVRIHVFMEDESVSVVEPVQDNSGLPQGVIVRRQRLPKNSLGDFLTFRDFPVGGTVTIYGRIFHICGCDKFTEDFLVRHGVDVGHGLPTPPDQYIDSRKQVRCLCCSVE